MFPIELISMLVSTILGGILSIMAQKSKDRADEQKMLMNVQSFNPNNLIKPEKSQTLLPRILVELLQFYVY